MYKQKNMYFEFAMILTFLIEDTTIKNICTNVKIKLLGTKAPVPILKLNYSERKYFYEPVW